MEENSKINIKLTTVIILGITLVAIIGILLFAVKNNGENDYNNNVSENYIISGDNTINDNQIEVPISNEEIKENFSMTFMQMNNNKENLIYSPLSIKYALKMLEEGASGNSRAQINNVTNGLKLTKYNNIDKVLSLANSVYIRNDYSKYVKDSFINALVDRYNAEVVYDSFESAKNVNTWIENKTLGIIKNMLKDEQVTDKYTRMLLINALAIDMAWANSFDANDTYGEVFYLENGTELQATTMHKETSSDNISYYKEKDITVLTMDLEKYNDTQLEFMAIMPNQNLNEYVKTVTIDEINNIANKLIPASEAKNGLSISIPKFSFDYDLELKNNLISLGITDVFDKEIADLSNISDILKNERLYVKDALHKANIDFSEEGVKAAAVTVFIMDLATALPGEQAKPEEIKINNPFLFLIRDKNTKEVWFVGTVYEPNSWENDRDEYQPNY